MQLLRIIPLAVILGTAVQASAGPSRGAQKLASVLDTLLADAALRGADVGVLVQRLRDGRTLYSRNADQEMVPASNVKLVTTAAAFHFLMPDFRFKTEVYLGNGEGRERHLYLKGYGDPYLTPERLWYLANRLRVLGLDAVPGDIIIDDSYFSGPRFPNGSDINDASYTYNAPSGAVSVGFNSVLVQVHPAANAGDTATVVVDPPNAHTVVRGRVRTVRRGWSDIDVSVMGRDGRDEIWVSGRIRVDDEPRGYWRRITNPPQFAGAVFKRLLQQAGIDVAGGVREAATPQDAQLLHTLRSPRLAQIVGWVNKHSNNFMAAQLARSLGAEVFEPPGTWEKGKRAVQQYLDDQVGIAPGAYALGNASGLHDVNRFTPRQIVRVLRAMHSRPRLRPEFKASLATAGGTGTLSDRMADTDAAMILRGKTGTLSSASALSGYVTTPAGEELAFSVLVNDYRRGITSVRDIQDDLGATLASWKLKEQRVDEGVPTAMTRPKETGEPPR